MVKLKLSTKQHERISEVFGNISVAWFSAGAVSPLFAPPQNIFDFTVRFLVSLVMSSLFLLWSLWLIRKVKND